MHWSVLTSEAFLIDLLIATACIVTGAGCVAMIRIANRQDRRREYDARALVDALRTPSAESEARWWEGGWQGRDDE